ncbi:hypothetical protein [Streptomyces gobiensis]|uniref:hypothetical protein n=1 Tax=Streptomyces gobiensis TaxID=2875706 RepID=UPI001E34ADD5|nr:hypothetical protein [Streptomyces gobiensis]UGY92628.1 hypothetical protein test1122_13475 [Streptomyces gobiensis]
MSIIHALTALARAAITALYGLEERHPMHPIAPNPPQPPAPAPAPPPTPLPRHRSPYGLDEPLCADALPLVRPYVAAEEQRQRRQDLIAAAQFNTDTDPYVYRGAL